MTQFDELTTVTVTGADGAEREIARSFLNDDGADPQAMLTEAADSLPTAVDGAGFEEAARAAFDAAEAIPGDGARAEVKFARGTVMVARRHVERPERA